MTGRDSKRRLKNQYLRQNNHIRKNYDRISVTLPRGTKEKIQESGETVNGLINRLVQAWSEDSE